MRNAWQFFKDGMTAMAPIMAVVCLVILAGAAAAGLLYRLFGIDPYSGFISVMALIWFGAVFWLGADMKKDKRERGS